MKSFPRLYVKLDCSQRNIFPDWIKLVIYYQAFWIGLYLFSPHITKVDLKAHFPNSSEPFLSQHGPSIWIWTILDYCKHQQVWGFGLVSGHDRASTLHISSILFNKKSLNCFLSFALTFYKTSFWFLIKLEQLSYLCRYFNLNNYI